MESMKTVPGDRRVNLHMPDGSKFEAFLEEFDDADEKTVWGWVAENEDEAPDGWTDGVCWAQNEDGVASTRPVGWSELEAR